YVFFLYSPNSYLHSFPTRRSSDLCYEVLNRIIQYFVTERSCLLTEAEPVIDTEFQRENFPNIVIPERSYISPFFMENVKDYIRVDRKSTRLNSSHVSISYAVSCLK